MELAVVIATYQREDGKSPFFLKRAIDSVMKQTHDKYKVFVVGDKYEDNHEFLSIVGSYSKEKLYYQNLKIAVEREKYKNNPEFLWNNGGVNAYNVGVAVALKDGFSYICHLDHDDQFLPDHLKIISEAIEKTGADWLCTKAICPDGIILPKISGDNLFNRFLPLHGGTINSSTCYNYKAIPLRYKDAGNLPSDYDLWQRAAKYIETNKLTSICVNKETIIYEKGGYERMQKKSGTTTPIEAEKKLGVSICCLTYNHENLIRDAIEGFIMQRATFPIEILIHDDASTDSTPKILREYEEKFSNVKVIYQKKNLFSKEEIYPFRFLYSIAKYRYNADCDGDDYWTDPLKLQKQVDFMEKNPGYSMCHHDYLVKNMRNGITSEPSIHKPKDYTALELIGFTGMGYSIHTSCKLWRNLYNEKTKKDFDRFVADYPLNVLMGMFGGCKYIPGIKPSIFRREHSSSSWTTLDQEKMRRITTDMHKNIYEWIAEKGNPQWTALRKAFVDWKPPVVRTAHKVVVELEPVEAKAQEKPATPSNVRPIPVRVSPNRMRPIGSPQRGADGRRVMPHNWR